jgi:cyclohexadienyl dehydratase
MNRGGILRHVRTVGVLLILGLLPHGAPGQALGEVKGEASHFEKKNGTPPLRVGTSGDYPPFSLREGDGGLKGFDITVARAYAADRGRPIEFVFFRWPELQTRLLEGDFDVAVGGVTVRGDRLVMAPMTATVARTDAVLLVRPGTVAIAHDWTAFLVGVKRGGHLEQLARARLARANIVAVDENLSLPNLLRIGQVDGIVIDSLEAPADLEIAQVLSHDRKAFWVSPHAGGLADDLDAWLEAREADGTLDRWRHEFFRQLPPPRFDSRLQTVIDLMGRRLMLMPAVAWAKQAGGHLIEDVLREETIEKTAGRAAREAGADESAYLGFTRVQVAAAKRVQKAALLAAPAPARPNSEEAQRELVQVLRPAIDRLDRAVLARLVQSQPTAAAVGDLAAALHTDAPVPGLDEETFTALAEALMRVINAPRSFPKGAGQLP